jgi:hypothetical protein
VVELALYVPRAPTSEEEVDHWRKNMQLVLDVVTGEDFPAGRSIQAGIQSGAQTHTVFGRNEPAMIHYHRSLRAALGEERVGNSRRASASESAAFTIPASVGPARPPAQTTPP